VITFGGSDRPIAAIAAPHALAALADRLVGQADDDEARHAGRDLALHLDPARIDAQVGDG